MLKVTFIITPMAGSKIVKNRLFSISGTRTPQKQIFWNFAVFYKSSPTFDPQNRPPKRALLENPFPTNRLCFCSNGGSKNVTFWGVGGRTARTEKCRHYYIAKIDFWALLDPHKFDHFDPAEWKFIFILSLPNLSVTKWTTYKWHFRRQKSDEFYLKKRC
jgi:hypothetical protein